MDFSWNYYAILGVLPTASEDDLRQAYRIAAKRFHPDVNKAPGANLLFQDINTAYEVLSDQRRRSEYDQVRRDRVDSLSHLHIDVRYSRQSLRSLREPQLLYVLAKIQPRLETMTLKTDAPLNLCLVIDRSKSMSGVRMQHLKNAAYRIIDECKPTDIISMVAFSDDAEVIVPAQRLSDPRNAKTMISAIRADGATAILAGLRQGLIQIERFRSSEYVNHLILITDGRTYGDEAECIKMATKARDNGIGISGMGIGEDWNDRFLDSLASQTGGSSVYINSPDTVAHFLHERIRSLATAYAERSRLVATPASDVQLNSITRLTPDAMTLPTDPQPILLGVIDGLAATSLLLQFHVLTDGAERGNFFVGRLDLSGEVLGTNQHLERATQDLSVEIGDHESEENPPPELLDALSKLMLYRLQDRARDAIENGDIGQATRSLEFLATRLFEAGQDDLGQAALSEAERVTNTRVLSKEGVKRLKYGTRALLPISGEQDG
ncbi:MAG: VWA domain-containing protein [Anaerolineae bacterium]|nr:VWA domain-containing protein [Anaerolineae bacterium]